MSNQTEEVPGIGFSGTRQGMTDAQKKTCRALIALSNPGVVSREFHHGAAIGADAEAAEIARSLRLTLWAWRGHNSQGESPDESAAAIAMSHVVKDPDSYFARNRSIVDNSMVLIACPPCFPLPTSGGTSYTVGYAVKRGVPVFVIWPNGEISLR